jgi:hypothetical protein
MSLVGKAYTSAVFHCHGGVSICKFILYRNNLILLVTQDVIGSFDFSEVFYIVYNNLQRHNAVEFFGVNNILVRVMQNPFFSFKIFFKYVKHYFIN